MPSVIKKVAFVLILSCLSSLLAVYFDGLEMKEISFENPLILGTNLIWVLIIAWIIWDLYKGVEIKGTLILVGFLMLLFLIYEVYESEFSKAQAFYAIELLMFVVAYFLLQTKESKQWYAEKKAGQSKND